MSIRAGARRNHRLAQNAFEERLRTFAYTSHIAGTRIAHIALASSLHWRNSRTGIGQIVRLGSSMPRESDYEKRQSARVEFSQGIDVQIVAIDGTWSRQCKLTDVSAAGAKLAIETSIEGLALKEFFLVLSTRGVAYRRCELAWVNGDHIGVHFLDAKSKNKSFAKSKAE